MFDQNRIFTWSMWISSFAILLFLALPLVLIVSFSFNPTGALKFPTDGLSLKWYYAYLESDKWLSATENSLITALGTMVVSFVGGVTAALGTWKSRWSWQNVYSYLIITPLLLPPVVIGVTLLMYLSNFGLQQSYLGIILAHSLWGTPLVYIIVSGAFARFDWDTKDAAIDVGATPVRAFVEIVLPGVRNSLVAAALIAFVVSLQEFVMALFLSGRETQTLPVLAWTSLRQSLDPIVPVVATLLILTVFLLLVLTSLTIGTKQLARDL